MKKLSYQNEINKTFDYIFRFILQQVTEIFILFFSVSDQNGLIQIFQIILFCQKLISFGFWFWSL